MRTGDLLSRGVGCGGGGRLWWSCGVVLISMGGLVDNCWQGYGGAAERLGAAERGRAEGVANCWREVVGV